MYYSMKNNGKISIIAKNAPYGNEFTCRPSDVCIKAGHLIHYDRDSPESSPSPSPSPSCFDYSLIKNFSQQLYNINMSHVMNGIANGNAGQKVNNGLANGGETDPLVHLCNNFNFPVANRLEFVDELSKSLRFIGDDRLQAMKLEISEYDPYQKGLVDASTLQRIFTKFYKSIPLNPQILQILFRCYAVDPKRPRLIRYSEMISMFLSLKSDSSYNESNSPPASAQAKTTSNGDSSRTGCSTAQSPLYQRGDAKLIMNLQQALQTNGDAGGRDTIDPRMFDVDQIRRALTLMDRGHRGTLSRADISTILADKGLYEPLVDVLPQLFERCTMNDDQYDWATLVDFLEKVHPVPGAVSPQSPIQQTVNHFYKQQQSIGSTAGAVLGMANLNLGSPTSLGSPLNGSGKIPNGFIPGNGHNHSPILNKLIEQLVKLDPNNSGTVLTSHAQKIVQKYNDLYQLGLNSKIIRNMVNSSLVNSSQSRLDLQKAIGYLQEFCITN